LLEHDTAREFVDEFAEVPLDCSEIVWVATANDAGRIPDPILNRMKRLRDSGTGRAGRTPDRAADVSRDPRRACLGRALSGPSGRRGARPDGSDRSARRCGARW